MSDCIFCKIRDGEVPSSILYQDDDLFVIKDIAPKAPVHLLIISRQHIPSITNVSTDHAGLIGRMVLQAQNQAELAGVAESGYKLIWNVGKHGGQTVPHLHLHLLGGKQLSE